MKRRSQTAMVVCGVVVLLFFQLNSRRPRAIAQLSCDNGDLNGDGVRDISDAVFLLRWLFQAGDEPVVCAQQIRELTEEQARILSYLSIVEPGQQNGPPGHEWVGGVTIRITGANLQIVNGLGATNGNPDDPNSLTEVFANGLGNLIVGYQEPSDAPSREGSHNVVIGNKNSYRKHGGLVVGSANIIDGAFATVTGGRNNTASNSFASVSGGQGNSAVGGASVVCGGNGNISRGGSSTVLGGQSNRAEGAYSGVTGGKGNTASGGASVVNGGQSNRAEGEYSGVSGGHGNTAMGSSSNVSGGNGNIASGESSEVLGGQFNEASGGYSVAVGGMSNMASEQHSIVPK